MFFYNYTKQLGNVFYYYINNFKAMFSIIT